MAIKHPKRPVPQRVARGDQVVDLGEGQEVFGGRASSARRVRGICHALWQNAQFRQGLRKAFNQLANCPRPLIPERLAEHDVSHAGGVRRKLDIPIPVTYRNMARLQEEREASARR